MSSSLGDYMNRYLLPGKPGSSVVLGKELALSVCEGEECSGVSSEKGGAAAA